MVHESVPITALIGIGLFFITAISLTIYVVRRNFLTKTVKIGFFTDAGHVIRKLYLRKNIKDTIDFENGKYIYDSSAEITTRRGKEMYFAIGSPYPIKFHNGKITTGKVNSENLKAIIETELIAKLFKKETFTLDNILLIVAIICSLGAIFACLSIKYGGVKLSDSPENVLILKDIIKKALESGV